MSVYRLTAHTREAQSRRPSQPSTGDPAKDPGQSNGTRPWVAHYKKRRTNRAERCGMVTPPDHHRCRWPVVPGTTTCAMHTPGEEHPNPPVATPTDRGEG